MWDGGMYETFAEARQRPVDDMLGRLEALPGVVRSVLDAGCGTGRTTHRLAGRFRRAEVVGVDASERMVDLAQPGLRVRFEHHDLMRWEPDGRFDLIVSNAVLHWMEHGEEALERHMGWVAPGGTIMVQVPANFQEPSHEIVRGVAAGFGLSQEAPWQPTLDELARPIVDAGWRVDAWETTYLHMLGGDDAVLRWLSGTTLRPLLQEAGARGKALVEALRPRLGDAYPPQGDITPFPFKRRMVVARCPTTL